MINKKLLAVLGCVMVLCACSTAPRDLTSLGAFQYTAYDQAGTKIVEGWMTLTLKDATTVSGRWQFQPIGDPQNIGPQVGSGDLGGDLHNGHELTINLNPEMADNNVFLAGTYTPTEITGTWSWATLMGAVNQGTFRAVK